MGCRFCRYELRTTDAPAARAFYADLLGAELWDETFSVVPLPERAARRGAPAHWLGHLGVGDVEETARRFVASGAERLGPLERRADGSSEAVLRDPFSAIVAVSSTTTAARGARIAWHLLHTEDEARAFSLYAGLFGWTPTAALDLGPERGRHRMFAWDESLHAVGSVANTARLPHVHPHWLFFFRVASVEESLAKVHAHGGITSGAQEMSTGDLAAPCDDPQGAAFGLYQAIAAR